MTEYGMVLLFIDQSPAFCLGFEAGVAYARMKYGRDADFSQSIHTENAGQVRAAGRATGWSVRMEPLDADWSVAHFSLQRADEMQALSDEAEG